MLQNCWLSKKGDGGVWPYIVGLVIGLFLIAFGIWLTAKSGNVQLDLFGKLK